MKTEYTTIDKLTVCRIEPDAPHPICVASSEAEAILIENALNAYEDLPEPEDMVVHNPHDLPSPGDGYRFFFSDEIKEREASGRIQMWLTRKLEWTTQAQGNFIGSTYRTKLSREELAKLK